MPVITTKLGHKLPVPVLYQEYYSLSLACIQQIIISSKLIKTQNKAGDDAKNAVRKLCEFSHKQEQEISPIQWKENNLNNIISQTALQHSVDINVHSACVILLLYTS